MPRCTVLSPPVLLPLISQGNFVRIRTIDYMVSKIAMSANQKQNSVSNVSISTLKTTQAIHRLPADLVRTVSRIRDRHLAFSQVWSDHPNLRSSAHQVRSSPSTLTSTTTEESPLKPSTETYCNLQLSACWQAGTSMVCETTSSSFLDSVSNVMPVKVKIQADFLDSQPTLAPEKSNEKHSSACPGLLPNRACCAADGCSEGMN